MNGNDTHERRRRTTQRRDAAANRERILEVAVKTVKREGVRVPMAMIAEEVGVGIGTVYRHFPTRDHLMSELTERSFEVVLDNAREASEYPGSARDAIGSYFEATIEDRDEFVLPWHGGPSVRSDRSRELQSEVWRLIEMVIHRGVQEGSVRRDLKPADVIQFGAMLAQPLPGASDWQQVARRQARVYLAGLAPTDSHPLSGRALATPRHR